MAPHDTDETGHLLAEKRAILAAALPHAAFDGWTRKLLVDSATAAGFDASMALRAFPGGAVDLIDFHVREADRAMIEALQSRDPGSLRIRDRIALAIRVRLEAAGGQREAIRKALQVMALPQNAPKALAQLYRTVDSIWYAIGDNATDFNFYTKRLLLAGVYSSTLLYWLDDKSEGLTNTWSFLDRRIADVMKIQAARGRVERLASQLPNPFRLFVRR